MIVWSDMISLHRISDGSILIKGTLPCESIFFQWRDKKFRRSFLLNLLFCMLQQSLALRFTFTWIREISEWLEKKQIPQEGKWGICLNFRFLPKRFISPKGASRIENANNNSGRLQPMRGRQPFCFPLRYRQWCRIQVRQELCSRWLSMEFQSVRCNLFCFRSATIWFCGGQDSKTPSIRRAGRSQRQETKADELEAAVADYIDFFNTMRPHRKLRGLSPDKFEKLFYAEHPSETLDISAQAAPTSSDSQFSLDNPG